MSKHLGRLAAQAAERGGTLIFEGQSYDAAALHQRALGLSGGLRAAGVEPGDRVVVLMANCPEVGIVYAAAWTAGAVLTPVVFLVTAPELAHILTDSGAKVVVTTPEFAAKVAETGVGVRVLVVGQDSYAQAEAHDPATLVDRADDDLAALLYTGGTTGRSKGVMLSHGGLWYAGHASTEVGYVPGETSSITALPLSHAFGLIVTIVGMHAPEPGFAVLQRWFDPGSFLALAAEHRLSRMAVVPSMLAILLAQPIEDHDLSALRFVNSGGAPLPGAVREEFERRLPGVVVSEGYGLTESSAVVSTNRPGSVKAGSVGQPLPGLTLRIEAPDGTEVRTGEDGEICAASPGVMKGYWRAPEATASTLRGGFLHTGDIGHLDRDGYLFVVDRLKDLIIRGGFNVYPRDVEDVLLTHPAVAAAAVVGRPDPRQGEEVVAFVTLAAGASATDDELIGFAKTRLAATKYPREVHLVEAIPLTSVGKTDRKALRARISAPVG